MIRRPPRSTRVRSSAASDVYKRQAVAVSGQRDDALIVPDTDCALLQSAPEHALRAGRVIRQSDFLDERELPRQQQLVLVLPRRAHVPARSGRQWRPVQLVVTQMKAKCVP